MLTRAILTYVAVAAAAPVHLGGFTAKKGLTAGAGFLSYDDRLDSLVVSAFTGDPLETDGVLLVRGVTQLLLSGNVSGAKAAPLVDLVWPNAVSPVSFPLGPGGAPVRGLLAPGGFLVPPKTVGAVTLLNVTADGALGSPPVKLTEPKGDALLDGWFYHRALPFDVDGDGLLDVLAARATKPLVGRPGGELVWAKQPTGPAPLAAAPWATAPLLGGAFAPDVFFTAPASLRSDGDEQIFYTSFFTGGGLCMVQCAGCAGEGGATWAAAAAAGRLHAVVLDGAIGPGFGVDVADLNGDGILDLLVTNHVDNATSPFASGVFAYVAPPAPTPLSAPGAWVKHNLSVGFAVREPGANQAAPGGAAALRLPGAAKPLIAVSGDGDQRAYVLAADADGDPANWDYHSQMVWDCKGTVGGVLPLLAGGMGYLFVACYDAGRVEAFSL
jgi:hypothetical protein